AREGARPAPAQPAGADRGGAHGVPPPGEGAAARGPARDVARAHEPRRDRALRGDRRAAAAGAGLRARLPLRRARGEAPAPRPWPTGERPVNNLPRVTGSTQAKHRELGLTDYEYERICEQLGRAPNDV